MRDPETAAEGSAGTAGTAALVRRHGRSQRMAHWWIAGTFALTCLNAPEGGQGLTAGLVFHITTALAMVAGVTGTVLFGNRASLASDARSLLRFDATDRAYLRSLTVPRARRQPVRWGKFNTGQKVAAWAMFALLLGVLVSGIPAATAGFAGAHKGLLALTFLVLLGHVTLAVIIPRTRPALRGMVKGFVDRSWAQREHPAWLDQIEAGESRMANTPNA